MKELTVRANNELVKVRRQAAAMSGVLEALNPLEQRIFTESTKKTISEYGKDELIDGVAKLVKFVARDAGIKSFDAYDVTRTMQLLKQYYSGFSLQEVSLAFELSLIGELDEYLPKDKNGQPDNNHYQSFGIGYVSKILNAYRRKRGDVESKVYNAIDSMHYEHREDASYYEKISKDSVINAFLNYKYHGDLPEYTNVYLLYSKLEKLGFSAPVTVNEKDKQKALSSMISKSHTGMIKEFVLSCIRHQKTNNSDVQDEAKFLAMKRSVTESFDRMIEDELQINDYIR